nr:hypothetical protein [Tanacetum cinerariifolium]
MHIEFLKDAAMLIQASNSQIPKTQRKKMDRDRYDTHDRLVAAYFSGFPMHEEDIF